MKYLTSVALFVLALALIMGTAACDSGEDAPSPQELSIEEHADEIVRAIEARNWGEVAEHVHPEKGVLFSPYAYVDPQRDLVFSQEEVATFGGMRRPRVWGEYDGSGHPIELTVEEYVEQFLYAHDFLDGQRGEPNEEIGSSTTRNNLPDVFGPNAVYIEYYVPPEDEHGMDWASLRVVFEETEDARYLVGLVQDQWTI